jgi:hypothetical protein
MNGPFLPFGHTTDFAVAADQSGRPCEAQQFPAMDGSSVPQATFGIARHRFLNARVSQYLAADRIIALAAMPFQQA